MILGKEETSCNFMVEIVTIIAMYIFLCSQVTEDIFSFLISL